MPTGAKRADYVLFVDGQAVGVIEAKKAGATLTGVEPQTLRYRSAFPDELPAFTVDGVLPFGYEATGAEDPLHLRAGPRARLPAGVRLPPARDPGPLARTTTSEAGARCGPG